MKWVAAEDRSPLKRDGVVLAGRRDASFYRRPGYAGCYHIAVQDERPACNTTLALLVDSTLQPAVEVPSYQRCNRPACARWWPASA